MTMFYILTGSVWLLGCLYHDVMAVPTPQICHYLGQEFELGELVTGDTCDDCRCTQFGIMCQLRACPPVDCDVKVRGKCCWECPKDCHYNGGHGAVVVPETGCLYGDGTVCHCYHGNSSGLGETMCFPPFPGAVMPACNTTSP